MKIDNVEWKGLCALAPMAGVADRAFREICMSFGAGYAVTEMVSAKGLYMHDRKSAKLLEIHPEERPCAAQLFGDDPAIMGESTKKAMEFQPDVIDINMGCPAPKIAGNGGGAALMKNPDLAAEIVFSVCKNTNVPVTVKMRTGWSSETINCVELARKCRDAGARAVTVHGRTKEQMYAPGVDYSLIKAVKDSLDIPVIANGDIKDGQSAKEALDLTGCDGIMAGRGALGRPWIFEQINRYLADGTVLPDPPVRERMEIMLRHISLICLYKGERTGMPEARKHAAWYTKGLRGSARLRNEICTLSTMDDLKRVAEKVVEMCGDSV